MVYVNNIYYQKYCLHKMVYVNNIYYQKYCIDNKFLI